jgi:hypothetical protein
VIHGIDRQSEGSTTILDRGLADAGLHDRGRDLLKNSGFPNVASGDVGRGPGTVGECGVDL